MTTIAFANGVLAADTQSTSGDLRGGYDVKIAKHGSVLAASAGVTALCQRFMDWFRAGMKGEPPAMKMDEFTAWGTLFYADDCIASLNEAGWERFSAPLWTNGTGGEIALGAMAAGKTPEEAVRIASRFDKSTGGEITVLRRHEPEAYSAPILQFRRAQDYRGPATQASLGRSVDGLLFNGH